VTRPPGALLLAVGYGAGLLTGLSRLTDPAFVAVLLGLLTWAAWGSSWVALLPAFGAGMIGGNHARAAAAGSCAARLPLGEAEYRVHAIDPGEGTGRVTIVGGQCTGAVMARWPARPALAAGLVVSVSARWAPAERPLHQPDGMLLIGKIRGSRGTPNLAERFRTVVVRTTHTLYGARAPLANTLIAGWRGELDPDLKAAFASAGLMHLLAVSGLHIAWLAGWVFLLLRLLRTRRHRAELLAATVALAYTAMLGWPPAAFRAATLLLVAAFCRWRQRQVRFGALLSLSALVVMVCDPWTLAMPGAWLSLVGVAGVVAAVRWSDHAIGRHWLVQSLSGSIGAVVATAPIVAAVFGQVAPIGVVLNLVGMPLLMAILPALFGSVALHTVLPPIATGLATSANGLLALLELLARVGAQAPGSGATGEAGLPAAIPWLWLLAAAFWMIHGRSTLPMAVRRAAWCGVVAFALSVAGEGQSGLTPGDHTLTLAFLDVGQGDAALIRTPFGHWIEVDAGPVGEGRDAGRRVVAPALLRLGARRVELFVLSHAHRDHVGGGAAVLDKVPVSLAIEPGELFSDSAYDGWLAALASHHTRWRGVHAGMHWTLDGVAFTVLHPPEPWPREGEDLNEDSVVLELTYGNFRALLMGDAGFIAESVLTATLPTVDLLKVGHHGSRMASGAAFLAAIRPQAAIISVGRNNYGHPAPETLARLADAGAKIWRTDAEGTITVRSDGRTFTVNGARSQATFGSRQ
jgi:competence protein ComEC